MQVSVEALREQKWTIDSFEVTPVTTVGDVKADIESQLGIRKDLQLLSCGTEQFVDEQQTLGQNGFVAGAELHLTRFDSLRSCLVEACSIPHTEHRGILLRQLRCLLESVTERCAPDGMIRGWYDCDSRSVTFGTQLQREKFNLYQAVSWIVKPATSSTCSSFVELVASIPEEQRPHWFVSHSWSEPVVRFVQCVEEHSRLRHMQDTEAWWICAYANNQHELGHDLTKDPRQTSFYRAMQLCMGVLLVLDDAGTPFQRIWCCFEEFVALCEKDIRPERMLLDIATVHNGSAQVITDGACAEDLLQKQKSLFRNINNYELSVKARREASFPPALVLQALTLIGVQRAHASMPIDKVRILNSIAMRNDSLDAEPLPEHPRYEEVNASLRAVFALAILPACAIHGDMADLDKVAAVLKVDTAERDRLSFFFADMPQFNDKHLACVMTTLPPKLKELTVITTRCPLITDAGVDAIAAKLPRTLLRLRTSFHGNYCVKSQGVASLAEKLPRTLRELTLSLGDCCDLDDDGLVSLGSALPSTLISLRLGLESCEKISDVGVSWLGQHLPKHMNTICINFMGCHGVGDKGVVELGIGLSPVLQTLNLEFFSCADLGNKGLAAIAWHLPPTLQELELDFRACAVDEAGIATLAVSLPTKMPIVKILFTDTNGDKVVADSIEKIVKWRKDHPDVTPLKKPPPRHRPRLQPPSGGLLAAARGNASASTRIPSRPKRKP